MHKLCRTTLRGVARILTTLFSRQLRGEWNRFATHSNQSATFSSQGALDIAFPRAPGESGHVKSTSILGSAPAMQELARRIEQVGQTKATVLIEGETGTGKELIAEQVHRVSRRASGPFVRLNCSALAETLLESELFGHVKGAFTGAVTSRDGRFAQADGGTLFLDEVSELPASTQVKLLRFLQEREFEPVGSNRTVRVDVRVVAACNRDLQELVEAGTFRSDLFYRLNVVRLDVPPLRDRGADILFLAMHFAERFSAEHGVHIQGYSEEAKALLVGYGWPGNVRELQNVVEQAVIFASGPVIEASELPLHKSLSRGKTLALMIPGATMEQIERYAIERTLEATGGSPTKAAAILGVSRRTIHNRLKEWNVTPETKGET